MDTFVSFHLLIVFSIHESILDLSSQSITIIKFS